MDRVELLNVKNFLLANSMDWFDPRAGYDNMDAHAWRAMCYFISGVTDHESESIERSNALIRKYFLKA